MSKKLPERISIFDVRRGLTDGDIVLTTVNDMVVAKIGEHWFAFGGDECEGITESVYIDTTPFYQTVDDIWSALNDAPINGETEEDAADCLYAKSFLEKAFRERDTTYDGKMMQYPMEEQIANCYSYLNWTASHKDPFDMTEEELAAAEKELQECVPGFSWVAHTGYSQMVPQDNETGYLILW